MNNFCDTNYVDILLVPGTVRFLCSAPSHLHTCNSRPAECVSESNRIRYVSSGTIFREYCNADTACKCAVHVMRTCVYTHTHNIYWMKKTKETL